MQIYFISIVKFDTNLSMKFYLDKFICIFPHFDIIWSKSSFLTSINIVNIKV